MRAFSAVLLACQLAGTWSGQTPSGWRIDALITIEGTQAVALVDMPDLAGFGRRFTGTADECRLHVERPQPAGRPPVILEATNTGDALQGTLQLLGQTAPVVLHRRASPLPQTRQQDVTFTNGAVKLAGTIVLPEARGSYPAIVFTHGGGPETRAVSQSLAIYLARLGIASLVYDKRGTGESTGEWEFASMDELARDAIAGVELLHAHAEIAKDRIGVYGYSQGGWIAPLAATIEPRIAFVIAGGLSAVNPMEQTIHHRTNVMRGENFDSAAVRKGIDLWRELYAARTREARVAMQERLRAARSEPWFAAAALPAEIELVPPQTMLDFLRFEPVPTWARVRQPAFLFWGANDIHVPVRESLRLLSTAVATDDLTVRIYPGLAHDLRIPSTDLPRVSTAASYEDVAQWMGRFTHGMVAFRPPSS